jgi:hypothetical protein
MKVYLPPSVRSFDRNFKIISPWIDHVPFGYDIVEAIKPKLTVELGTHNGLSFFSFCQSLIDNHIDGLAYAVDTWEGEKHSGEYDDSVYATVADFCRENYAGCSYLMRMLFADALRHFGDESIDILHVDGLHTYDAVSEDFSTWFPKVKPGGIVLFHDVTARTSDYGVWRFWEELTSGDYETYHFNHSYGLGVLRKAGGDRSADSQLIDIMFNGSVEDQDMLRAFYVFAARYNVTKNRPPMVMQKKTDH